MAADIVERVRAAAKRRVLFLPHAVRQMSRPDRMIQASVVEAVVHGGDLVEDYPNDVRGHSCLLLGRDATGRPIHVVCSPKDDFVAVITAYVPDEAQWADDFRSRR